MIKGHYRIKGWFSGSDVITCQIHLLHASSRDGRMNSGYVMIGDTIYEKRDNAI